MSGVLPPEDMGDGAAIVHGTCLAVAGQGALIVGQSGAGKSGLALQMMAHGACLVGDDRVMLRRATGRIMADAVNPLRGLIEARGIGLLQAETAGPVPLAWVVDLDRPAPARLPDPEEIPVLGQPVPLLRGSGTPNLAAALMQLMKIGRVDPQWPSN